MSVKAVSITIVIAITGMEMIGRNRLHHPREIRIIVITEIVIVIIIITVSLGHALYV